MYKFIEDSEKPEKMYRNIINESSKKNENTTDSDSIISFDSEISRISRTSPPIIDTSFSLKPEFNNNMMNIKDPDNNSQYSDESENSLSSSETKFQNNTIKQLSYSQLISEDIPKEQSSQDKISINTSPIIKHITSSYKKQILENNKSIPLFDVESIISGKKDSKIPNDKNVPYNYPRSPFCTNFAQDEFKNKTNISKPRKPSELGKKPPRKFILYEDMNDSDSEMSSPESNITVQSGNTESPKTDSVKKNYTAKVRPKSRIGLRAKISDEDSDTSPKFHDDNSSFIQIIPPQYISKSRATTATNRTKTSKHTASDMQKSYLVNKTSEYALQSNTHSNVPSVKSNIEPASYNLQSKNENDSDSSNTITENTPFRGPIPGEYDPEKYNNLEISNEIKEIFSYIMKYTPTHVNLDTKFKPFIPDYIPAVGDVDAFLKVIEPEKNPFRDSTKPIAKISNLGLHILDEPSTQQSDSAFLHLQLRATIYTPDKDESNMIVKKVYRKEKNSNTINKWIEDVTNLHKTQPPVSVNYQNPMPSIETLIKPWPPNFELLLHKNGFPSPKLQCSLSEYINLTCTMLDIPVYANRIESLHLLFTLFMVIRQSQVLIDNLDTIDTIKLERYKDVFEITDDPKNKKTELVTNNQPIIPKQESRKYENKSSTHKHYKSKKKSSFKNSVL